MKTLIVYFSRDGHTKKIADALASKLSADIEEIKEQQERKGIIGWIMAGHDACRKKMSVINETTKNPADYDLIIIGTPIWGWTIVPAIRTWLDKFGKNLKQVAFFASMGGSGDKRAFVDMENMCGKAPVGTVTFLDKETNKNLHLTKLENFVNELQQKTK